MIIHDKKVLTSNECYKCKRVAGETKIKFRYTTRHEFNDNVYRLVCDKCRIKRHYEIKAKSDLDKIIKGINKYFYEKHK
jgi:hypothetical protein